MKKKNNGIYILISTIIFCVFGYYTVNNILFHLEKNNNVIRVEVDDKGIAAGVENVYDATVAVTSKINDKQSGVGSGFVFSKDGYILTNYHVIEKNDTFSVIIDDEYVLAELIGSDKYADVAVLKVDPKKVKQVAVIGDSKAVRIGDTIFTVGAPIDIKYMGTVTRGIISGKNRQVEYSVGSDTLDWIMEVIQIDAAINNGNSGGPLCNVNGEVIGINTFKIASTGTDSIAFAIPIETAIEYANKIIKGEEIDRPMLGIRMSNVYNTSHLSYYGIKLDSSILDGVVVIEPIAEGAGYKAGLKKGDVIVKINNTDVTNIAEFNYNLFKYKSGEKVKLEVIRGKEKLSIEVTLDKKEK